ncbi:MAG: hypothetical protein MZV64_05180 [Ignavibacteriales bacterium]|nr:hypothetical protein [Ignavibacteriales bacterium]
MTPPLSPSVPPPPALPGAPRALVPVSDGAVRITEACAGCRLRRRAVKTRRPIHPGGRAGNTFTLRAVGERQCPM